MCYEARFFKSWAKQKAPTRAKIEAETERVRSSVRPIRPAPEREITRREEVERELDKVV
jgi:hypothetical protein